MFSARKPCGGNRAKHRSILQKSRSFFRPRLEALEDRCIPATINTWAALIGPPSNWNNSVNWSLGHVPTGSEIATFNSTSQTFCFIDAPVAGTNAVSGINITSQYGGQIQDAADLVIGTDGFVQAGGAFFVDFFAPGSTTITDAGNWLEGSPFGFNAGPGATVDFNSATSQTILDDNTQFFNLTHSGAGTLNLTAGPGPLPIAGNFVNSSGTVDAHGASLRIGGNWTDTSSVVNLNMVTFNPFSPTTQTVTSNSNFNNVNYGGPPPATLQLLTPVTLTGDFTVAFGTFDANGQNMTVAGNWSNGGTVENTATVLFNGTQEFQFLDSGGSPFKDLVHNGVSILKLMTNPLMVTGTLDNELGTLDPNDQPVTVTGLTKIIASAMLNSGNSPTETITLNGGLLITGAALNSGPGRTILGAGVTASSGFNVSSTIMGNLDLGGANRTFTVSAGTQVPDLIVLAQVSNGAISKDGNGVMELANSNQYGGDTIINAGILDVSHDGALGSGGQILGPTVTILGNTGDGSIDFTGDVADISSPQVRVGTGGNDVAGEADIFLFALPKLTSPASILGAQLNLQYLGISQFTMTVTPEFNVDLFGLGARSTPTIFASDYYDGDASLSTDSLIAKGFITPSTAPGSLQTSGASLLNYLESLYQPDGTPKAAYAVFRANADVHLPPGSNPYRGYELASADNTDNNGAFVPRLQLTIVPQAAAGTGGTTVAAGAVLQFSNAVAYKTPEVVTLNGGSLRSGSLPDDGFSGSKSFAGPIFLGSAGSIISAQSGSDLILNGPINAGGFDLTITGTGATTINGPINGVASATLTKQGTGSLTLNAANNYGGGTTVSSGTLIIGNDSAVGTGTLTLADGTTIVVTGADHSLANSITLNGNVTVGTSANTLTFNGVVSGPGSLILNGNLTLNANNTYAGTTTVNAATLTLSSLFPLEGGGALILNGGSTLVPSNSSVTITNQVIVSGPATLGGTSDFVLGNITGAGTLTDMNPASVEVGGDSNFSGSIIVTVGTVDFGGILGTGSLVLDDGTTLLLPASGGSAVPGSIVFNGHSTFRFPNSNNTVCNLGGTLSGPGGFTFVGGFLDWLILSGTSTYSGTTFVDGATLNVRGSQPNSPIVIDNMGTLWGSGTVGDVTLNNGTLDPTQFGPGVVASTAILTTGNLKLNGGVVQFSAQGTTPGTGYNQLRVNGNVDLGPGDAAIHISSSKFPLGTQLRFIDNLSANPISGHFSLNPEGTVVFVGGNKFRITYIGGDGNDMVAIAITYGDILGRVNETGQWWLGLSNASSFSNNLATTWSTAVTWVDVQTGDFNGDGLQDIVGRAKETGQWWVSLSNGSGGFTTSLWDTWSTAVTWVDVKVGDFKGDGKMDIVGRALESGQWWMAQSTGSTFTNSLWATWSTAATWVDVKIGDFNGDGKADITGRYLQGGSWWTGLSNGSTAFNTSLWTTWSTGATWVDVQVGDFSGDGKADIVGRYLEGGQWWAGISTGSSFTNSLWTTWSTAATWVDVQVGDFNGDGKADITGRWLEGGQWWTAISTGSSFVNSLWATWSTGATWVDVQVGDFNGDGKADITGRYKEGGTWWTGISNGSMFTTTQWAVWSTGVTWVDVRSGAFV